MAVDLDDRIRKALEGEQFWTLATVNPDGSSQATVVWVDVRDEKIIVNSALGRKKPRNLARNPSVALAWFDPENPYSSITIQGRVVESYTGEQAEADIDALARMYLGKVVYPWRADGERRISYLIEPEHIGRMGG